MTYKEKLANGDELWRSERGQVRCSTPAASVVVIAASGHITPDLVPLCLREVERRILRGVRVHWFGEYSGITGYDSEGRVALTEFLAKYRDRCESVTILTRHRILAMGVAVANLALGGMIDATADREKFERILATTIAQVNGTATSAVR